MHVALRLVGWATRQCTTSPNGAKRGGGLPTRRPNHDRGAWAKLRDAVQIIVVVPGNLPTLQAEQGRDGRQNPTAVPCRS
jgi:hypothetical protein